MVNNERARRYRLLVDNEAVRYSDYDPVAPASKKTVMNYIRKHREYLDIVRADIRATL